MLEIMPDGSLRQHPFAPEFGSCNSSPIKYNPEAKWPMFLEKLLGPCMEADDMECFQLYFGQCLLGVNVSQTFLMLTGTPQSGKSTLVNIVERIVGRSNCTELRLEHMAERFEMHRLLGKNLLTAKDVKSYFLNTKGAYKLKALIGRDTMTTEAKGSNETYDVSGDCNVIITANSNLTVDIDSDNEAWKRRMLLIRYECPPVQEKIDAVGLFQHTGGGGKEFPADVGDAPHQHHADDPGNQHHHQHCAGPDQHGHYPVPCPAGGRKAVIHRGFLPSVPHSAQR